MAPLFITGTGTGVGKTFVASGLIRHLRKLEKPVDALKPVASGFDPSNPRGSDPAILAEALGRKVTLDEIKRISPWRFRAPLSPDMAARVEGKSIDFPAVVEFCRSATAQAARGTVLIEGIGGIMVPLDERHTVLDLMIALELPLILVGGTYLGTLSHVLSAQDVVLRRGLDLRAIVISESAGGGPPFEATLTTLSRFAKAPLMGLPRQAVGQQSGGLRLLAKLIV